MDRAELKESLAHHLQMANDCIELAAARLKYLYPSGMRVEVRFDRRQHNWTPASVISSGIQTHGAAIRPYVMVGIGRKKHSRLVWFENIRPLAQENS